MTLKIIFAAAGLALAVTPALAQDDSTAPKPVAIETVHRGDLTRTVTLEGQLKPFVETDLHAKAAGYLKSISVDIGDRVKAGQVIAELEIPEVADDVARDAAKLKEASLDYDRLMSVARAKPGFIAQQDIDKAKALFDEASAELKRQQTLLDYGRITASFDGVVTRRFVDPGALIQTGVSSSTQAMPIVHVAQDKLLRLQIYLPESLVSYVKKGTPITVTAPDGRTAIPAKISRLAGKIDDSTRTMLVEADIDNADLKLSPGAFEKVVIPVESRKDVVVLSLSCIKGGDNPSVFVVNDRNVLERRPLQLGLQSTDAVEVKSGVTDGDRVVRDPASSLQAGAKVAPQVAQIQSSQDTN